MPLGPTERLVKLKENFLKQVPSITTYRARAVTKITKENPGMPKIELRAKCFKYCCETAPLVIQDNELIVGAPNGAPRAGAFSPDIAWRWMVDEIDTIGDRPQDPFYISDEDKRIMREELFHSGKANLLTNTAKASIVKQAYGSFPENHLFPTVRITLSTEAETPTLDMT